MIATLSGHEDLVRHAVFNGDGDRIVTASFDNTTRIWTVPLVLPQVLPQALSSIDISVRLAASASTLFRLGDSEARVLGSTPPAGVLAMASVGSAAGPRTLWLAGRRGMILRSPDAAPRPGSGAVPADPALLKAQQTVQSTPPPPVSDTITLETTRPPRIGQGDLHAIRFIDEETGLAGGDVVILRTLDGGGEWNEIYLDEGLTIHDIHIQKDGAAWAVARTATPGDTGFQMLHTANIGADGLGTADWQVWSPRQPLWPWVLALPATVLFFGLSLAGIWLAFRRKGAAGYNIRAQTDKPLEWDAEEARTLRPIARQLSRFLRNIHTEPPLVLAVNGRWGSGKSSLMNLLKYDLTRRNTQTVWFNAWHHRQEEDLPAALLENVRLQAIPHSWTLTGFVFRLRLFWHRSRDGYMNMGVMMVWLLGLSVLAVAVLEPETAVNTVGSSFKNQFPKTVSSLANYDELIKLGGPAGFLGVFGYWLVRKTRAMPLSPARLISKITSRIRIADFKDKLGFRFRIAKALNEICRALRFGGSPGLVIFVDDLDRCKPDHTLSVLESINFLVTAAPCIIVLGIDRRQVEHVVGEAFKEIADGIPIDELIYDFDLQAEMEATKGKQAAADEPEDVFPGKRRAFARHYLEKRINLEVAVPKISPEDAASLVVGGVAEKAENEAAKLRRLREEQEKNWDRLRDRLRRTSQLARAAVFFAIFVFLVFQTWENYRPIAAGLADYYQQQFKEARMERDENAKLKIELANTKQEFELAKRAQRDLSISPVPAQSKPTTGARKTDNDLASPGSSSNSPLATKTSPTGGVAETLAAISVGPSIELKSAPPYVAPKVPIEFTSGGLGALAIIIYLIFVLYRQITKQRKNIERDPETFNKALREFAPVVLTANATPRAVKRYSNKMRVMSSRVRPFVRDKDLLAHLAGRVRTLLPLNGQLAWLAPDFLFEPNGEGALIKDEKLMYLGVLEVLDPKFLANDDGAILKKIESGKVFDHLATSDQHKKEVRTMLQKACDVKGAKLSTNEIAAYKTLTPSIHAEDSHGNGSGKLRK